MLIVCPNCVTSYQVDATAIGTAGRSVRCTRCQEVWFAAPPAEVPVLRIEEVPALAERAGHDDAVDAFRSELGGEASQPPDEDPSALGDEPPAEAAEPPEADAGDPPAPSPDDVMATGPAAGEAEPELAYAAPLAPSADPMGAEPVPPISLAEIPIPIEDAPPLAPMAPDRTPLPAIENGRADIESFVARRRPRAGPHRRRALPQIRLPVVIMALVALSAALLAWRKDVVRHAPQMASLYAAIGLPVNLRGLAFADVASSTETHDGVPVLVVSGTIVSTVSTPVEVPRLRFALRNAAGGEVYAWTAMPAQPILEPGGTLPFRSRLASPPNEGRDVQVRFFTRHDAVAGLR